MINSYDFKKPADRGCVWFGLRQWVPGSFVIQSYLAQREPYRSAIIEQLGPELSTAFFDSLPETGLFESGTVTFRNGRQPIERLNHKDWVAKVAGGSSARGIIIGRSSSRARWQQAMLDLYDSRLILQRFEPPRRYRFTYLGPGNEPRSDLFLTKLGLYSFGGRAVGYELNGCPNSYKIHGGRGSTFTPVFIQPTQREQETHGIWVPGSSHSPTEE